jgi:zinc transporter ZupT
MDPILLVLLYSSVAAAVAAVGAAQFLWRNQLRSEWVGWSNAVAAGLMLGAAYALMVTGVPRIPPSGVIGVLIGLVFINRLHAASGTSEIDLNRLEQTSPEYGYQVLLVNTFHAGSEGVAIGAAMSVSLPFGVFMALAIAVHNIPEGMVLTAILRGRDVRLGAAAGLVVATNVSQVLMAIVVFALVTAAPGLLPWALGFAAGSLVYLVLAELLPQCYRQAGPTSIALVTIVAMGIVILLASVGA